MNIKDARKMIGLKVIEKKYSEKEYLKEYRGTNIFMDKHENDLIKTKIVDVIEFVSGNGGLFKLENGMECSEHWLNCEYRILKKK